MKTKELCAMRYMDLGVGESNTLLAATFTMTSKWYKTNSPKILIFFIFPSNIIFFFYESQAILM